MKKLILFLHGLGGGEGTWGDFKTIIEADNDFKGIDVAFYNYKSKLLNIKSISGVVLKIFAIVNSKRSLPKIQDIAELLNTEIEERYADYDEIYLITHSMGGLVARMYLYNMLKKKADVQVKKLMLYAVPNNGSDWTKFAKYYKHEQIKQLDKDSLFLQFLNQDFDDIKMEESINICSVVGKFDDVVNENSAKGYWKNPNVKSLPKGHSDIVKPIGKEDLSFVVLKNFLIGKSNKECMLSPIKTQVEDVLNNSFVDEVISLLKSKKLLTLFSQDFSNINTQQALVKQKMQFMYKAHFFHLRVPHKVSDEAIYFRQLSEGCGFLENIQSLNDWSRAVSKYLENNPNKVCFYITNIENGDERINREFASVIRNLQDEFAHCYILFIGRKTLASLVYGKDSKLSPLNTAEKLFFHNAEVSISMAAIRQEFENLKLKLEDLCAFLDDDVEIEWLYYSNSVLNTLFWKNIMQNKNNKYVWRDEETKLLAKEIFEC